MPRIDQLLARNLACSRRDATRLLRTGRVRGEDGELLADPRWRPELAALPLRVSVSDEPLLLRDAVHLLQHKPVGVVTALADPLHPTAYALLRGRPLFGELRAVGRLDLDASGLLLWTSDGAKVHALTHPRREVSRSYQVALARPWSRPVPASLELDGRVARIDELRALAREELHPALQVPAHARDFATITLVSGRFHAVKRIFAALDSEVIALARVAHGDHRLPVDLAPGECVEVEL